MLFLIRSIETGLASCMPSILGLILLFMNARGIVMAFVTFLSFLAFCALNLMFWMKYSKQRTNRREFYIMNGLTYLIYAAFSVIIYIIPLTGSLVYTVLFSNLRWLEIFGLSTFQSLVAVHIFMLCLMVGCEIYSRHYYRNLLKRLIQNSSDQIEMNMHADKVAEKNGDEIQFLSVNEMSDEIERDKIEATEMLMRESAKDNEEVFSRNMTKGRGEKIEWLNEENLDDELSIEEDPNRMYDADSLWNSDIYQKNNGNSGSIDDYPDEDEVDDMYDPFVQPKENMQENYDVESGKLWSDNMYVGVNKQKPQIEPEPIEEDEDDGYEIAEYTEYDADNLWSRDFKQGSSSKKPQIAFDPIDEEGDEGYEINSTAEYDTDSLWDKTFYQGRNTGNTVDNNNKNIFNLPDNASDTSLNMLEDYDTDKLWDNINQEKYITDEEDED